jgi:hypothetical protein
VTLTGGSLVIATPASSFTSIGLSTVIWSAMGLSVATFKFTVSGQPDKGKASEAAMINFPGNPEEEILFIFITSLNDKKIESR